MRSGKIDEAYIAANDQFIRHDLGGQKVAFAKGAKPDDTTLQTKALYWEGLFPTFYGSLAAGRHAFGRPC